MLLYLFFRPEPLTSRHGTNGQEMNILATYRVVVHRSSEATPTRRKRVMRMEP